MKPGTPSPIPNASVTFVESSNPEVAEVGVELEGSWRRVIGEGMSCQLNER